MASYVKFRRGTPEAFKQLGPHIESDTLYFIYEDSETSADLYLGSRKISGDGGVNINSLAEIEDIIVTELKDKDLLVYDSLTETWINKSIDEIIETISTVNTPKVIMLVNSSNNSHQDLLKEILDTQDVSSGDVVVIKDLIGVNQYEHTGYVFDGLKWVALDGNYSAENVYFSNDFIVTENIGTIKIDANGSATIPAKGKNLKELLSNIFAKEQNPITKNPSATIDLIPSTLSYEVGTTYTPGYKVTFNKGSYSYDQDTGVIPSYVISNSKNEERLDSSSGNFSSFTIEDDTNYQITASVSYSNGIIPKTNLGNEYPEGQILAGQIADIKTKTVKGYRSYFYGTFTEKKENLTTEDIRSLNATKNNTFSIDINPGDMRVIFAYPQENENDMPSSVKDVNGLNAEIASSFTKMIVNVEGANGYKAIPYNVFINDRAEAATVANVFDVTIKGGN